MGKAHREETTQQSVAPAEVELAGDGVATIYGLTLGEIVKDRNGVWSQLVEAKAELVSQERAMSEKNDLLLKQSERIEALEREAKEASSACETLRAQVEAKPSPEQIVAALAKSGQPGAGMQLLPDGSLRVTITVPTDAATPLLSWAEGAGEDPTVYIQRNLEEALLAFTAS